MACCAFAIFVIGQIAVFFGGLRVLVPRRFRRAEGEPRVYAETAWQLHPAPAGIAPAVAPSLRRKSFRRWLLAGGLVAELALGGAAFAWTRGEHPPAPAETPAGWASVWCSGAVAAAARDH